MASLTTYAANKQNDHMLSVAPWTMPTHVWVGLFTTKPGAAGTQTGEVAAASYARQQVTYAAAVAGVSDNAQLTWTQAGTGEDWGTPGWFGILDAATGGNMLATDTLSPGMHITAGMQYVVAAAALRVTNALAS